MRRCKAAADRIERMAHYDELTSLPNRVLLKDRLDQALAAARRHHRRLAVLFLDLDRFKAINDAFGHNAGDCLLVEVAKRLKGVVREDDTVARLGGDEFIILVPDAIEARVADSIAGKVILCLTQPFDIEGQTIYTSSSVGIALFPDDGETAPDLIKAADTAMYRAKDAGRGRYRFHSQ